LITASASALILDEELTPAMFGAAALVFAGIWLVARRPRPAVAVAAPPT
jgi:drug/metabolite transporter (DMT)-like permease